MVGTYDLIVAALSLVVSLGIVGVSLYRRYFLRYFLLNLYLIVSVTVTLGCLYFIHNYGYTSQAYFYFYYSWDPIATIIAYLLVGSFFDEMLRPSVFRRYVCPTLGLLFVLLVGISWLYISRSSGHLYSRFIIEFQQNMFFVGVLLTFLLWLSMMYLGAETRHFALLVSGLGIYFAAHACNYAARALFPMLADVTTRIPPLAYNLMAVVWFYTFLAVREDEPAPALVRHRRWVALKVGVHEEKIE